MLTEHFAWASTRLGSGQEEPSVFPRNMVKGTFWIVRCSLPPLGSPMVRRTMWEVGCLAGFCLQGADPQSVGQPEGQRWNLVPASWASYLQLFWKQCLTEHTARGILLEELLKMGLEWVVAASILGQRPRRSVGHENWNIQVVLYHLSAVLMFYK